MPQGHVLVFDLDDTLYLERTFVVSGFRAAGEWLCREEGVAGFADACLELFEAGLRGRVFDMALAQSLPGREADLVPRLVAVYRGHRPAIALEPDARRCLARFAGRCRTGLVTDGPPESQEGKIAALGLDHMVGRRVVTGAWGPGFSKPHPRAFVALEAWAGARPEQMVYVADNATKDFLTPRARGWRTLQIARPGRLHPAPPPAPEYAAEACITSLDDLDEALRAIFADHPRILG